MVPKCIFCTSYHLVSIERIRMKFRGGSIYTYRKKRQLSKLGKENEGKMCINKQKNGDAERISSCSGNEWAGGESECVI